MIRALALRTSAAARSRLVKSNLVRPRNFAHHFRRSTHTEPVSALHARAQAAWQALLEADWVDTDEKLTLLAEQAKSLLDEYRSVYTVDSPVDELYHSMHSLYIASEAAMISDAYAEHVEVVFRDHEDMVGALGNNPEIPEGREQEALQMLKDYVKFVSAVDNPDVKRKLIRELGGKMILIKMLLSVENFSAIIAPVASDRIMTETVNP